MGLSNTKQLIVNSGSGDINNSSSQSDPAHAVGDELDFESNPNEETGVSSTMSAFGDVVKTATAFMDNPTVADGRFPVVRALTGINSSVDVPFVGERFELEHKSLNPASKDTFGTAESEMLTSNLISRFHRVATLRWDSSALPGKVLATYPISPSIGSVVAGVSNTVGPMNALAQMATWWRGGIRLRVQVVASKFHSGRLLLTNHYGVFDPATIINTTISERTNQYLAYVDIKNGQGVVDLTLPYVNKTRWSKVPKENVDPRYCSLGLFAVSVMNRLTFPVSVADYVYINIYAAADSDMAYHYVNELPAGGKPGIPWSPLTPAGGHAYSYIHQFYANPSDATGVGSTVFGATTPYLANTSPLGVPVVANIVADECSATIGTAPYADSTGVLTVNDCYSGNKVVSVLIGFSPILSSVSTAFTGGTWTSLHSFSSTDGPIKIIGHLGTVDINGDTLVATTTGDYTSGTPASDYPAITLNALYGDFGKGAPPYGGEIVVVNYVIIEKNGSSYTSIRNSAFATGAGFTSGSPTITHKKDPGGPDGDLYIEQEVTLPSTQYELATYVLTTTPGNYVFSDYPPTVTYDGYMGDYGTKVVVLQNWDINTQMPGQNYRYDRFSVPKTNFKYLADIGIQDIETIVDKTLFYFVQVYTMKPAAFGESFSQTIEIEERSAPAPSKADEPEAKPLVLATNKRHTNQIDTHFGGAAITDIRQVLRRFSVIDDFEGTVTERSAVYKFSYSDLFSKHPFIKYLSPFFRFNFGDFRFRIVVNADPGIFLAVLYPHGQYDSDPIYLCSQFCSDAAPILEFEVPYLIETSACYVPYSIPNGGFSQDWEVVVYYTPRPSAGGNFTGDVAVSVGDNFRFGGFVGIPTFNFGVAEGESFSNSEPPNQTRQGVSILDTVDVVKQKPIYVSDKFARAANGEKSWSIADMVERWIQVGDFSWSAEHTEGQTLASYRIPLDVLKSLLSTLPFSHFVYLRYATIKMRFQLATPLTSQGILQVVYQQAVTLDDAQDRYPTYDFGLSVPNCQLSAKDSTIGEISIPFNHVLNWLFTENSLGDVENFNQYNGLVRVGVLNPFVNGEGGATETTVNVLASIEGLQANVPRLGNPQ